MVVSGGVNLYPAEAEQILIDHKEIKMGLRHTR